MPSCVVKSCRNQSRSIKKSQGITFHRFPSANDVWKNDWIKIIRECRNENNWNPSKFSVICSIHFEKNDLYTTEGGLLRVVAYAIPTKFLYETSTTIQENEPADVITSSDFNRSSLVTEAVASGPRQQIKLEQPFCQNVTTPLTQSSLLTEAVASGPRQQIKLEQPFCQNVTMPLTHSSLVIEAVAPGSRQQIKLEQPFCQNVTTPLTHSSLVTEAVVLGSRQQIKLEQPFGQNVTMPLTHSSLVIEAVSPDSRQQIKLEQPFCQNVTTPLTHSSLLIEAVASGSRQQIKLEQPFCQNVTTPLTQSSSEDEGFSVQESTVQHTNSSLQNESSETAISGVKLEQTLSLQFTLKKMRARVQNQKKKIKVLHQKVRRLEDRNKSLKGILKTLKDENYIDSDLFNKLNEDLVAANIFNNYNRKRLQKKLKSSPSLKKFCQTLNSYSPKAYDYVRDTFNTCLPHRKTLAKWDRHFNAEPDFTEEPVQVPIESKSSSEHQPLCTVLFDEVDNIHLEK